MRSTVTSFIEDKNMRKGIIYYTDNVLKKSFAEIVRKHLKSAAGDIPIVWVSQKPIKEENNIVCNELPRSHQSICFQVLSGIQSIDADIIYLAEHDILYHPCHFDFIPPKEDVFYYNVNRYWLREKDGQASYKKTTAALSQLVAYKGIMEDFFSKRFFLYFTNQKVGKCKTEPGKFKVPELPDYKMERYHSKWPNIDIRHGRNYTSSDRFKKRHNYTFEDEIPGWGKTKGRFKEFINGI